jgi:hypothetical protein
VQERKQAFDSLPSLSRHLSALWELELLDELDSVVERVSQRHNPGFADITVYEAKALEHPRIERCWDGSHTRGHPISLEGSAAGCPFPRSARVQIGRWFLDR